VSFIIDSPSFQFIQKDHFLVPYFSSSQLYLSDKMNRSFKKTKATQKALAGFDVLSNSNGKFKRDYCPNKVRALVQQVTASDGQENTNLLTSILVYNPASCPKIEFNSSRLTQFSILNEAAKASNCSNDRSLKKSANS
jgi:hypothetical protein